MSLNRCPRHQALFTFFAVLMLMPGAAATPIVPIGAVSRKTHGSVGSFDVALPLTGAAGLECRSGGSSGNHQIVLTFAVPVTFASASVSTGTGSVSSSSESGAQATVNLTGITNAQRITLTLSGVSDGITTNDVIVPIRLLLGDVNSSGVVSVSDVNAVKGQSLRNLTESNFRTDINASGVITTADVNAVKSKALTTLTESAPKSDKLSSGFFSASLVLQSDGSLWSWGQSPGGGAQQPRSYPLPLTVPSNVISVSAGDSHTAVLARNGVVWSWGKNDQGQVGDGTTTERNSAIASLSNVISVKAGGFHTLALLQDGTVAAWGRNNYGQLGDDEITGSAEPVAVTNLTGVTQIAAGYERSLALKSDGTLWTWGFESEDPEIPATVFYTVPTPVAGLSNVSAIAAGFGHAIVVKNDGTVWAWGSNASGELGNSSITNYSAAPVQVNISNAVAVSASYDHTLALLSDGTVRAWGSNTSGQLGNGTTEFTAIPVPVIGLTSVTAIMAAKNYSMALKSDGTVWAWGQIRPETGLPLNGDVLAPQQVVMGQLDQNTNGMDDRWEMQYFGNLDQTAAGDFDQDGISNLEEFQTYYTHPNQPDSDSDFSSDGEEVAVGADPNDPSSYPPRLRDVSRTLAYDFTTQSSSGQLRWSENWNLAPEGSEEWNGATYLLTQLAGILAERLPFPDDMQRSPNYGAAYDPDSSSSSFIFSEDFSIHAEMEHRRYWLHRFPATQTEARKTVLLFKKWLVDGAEQLAETRVETLIIAPGQTTSNPVDLVASFTQDFPEPWSAPSYGEQLEERVLPIAIEAITFSGDKYWELISDNAATTYAGPHWVDQDGNSDPNNVAMGERNYAVAFTRNTKPKIGAAFKILGAATLGAIEVRAHGSDGIEIPATPANVDGDYVALPSSTESTTPFVDTIKYYNKSEANAFTLQWEVKIGNADWVVIGTTKHSVYVTLGDPVPSALQQESLYEISCRNADGVSEVDQVTDAVWNEFIDREVRRVDGVPLTYYQNYNTTNVTTETLLASGDGQCGAWTRFFIDLRKVHGIDQPNEFATFRPSSPAGVLIAQRGFVVKNWSFSGTGISGVAGFPYLNIPPEPLSSLIATSSYNWRYAEVSDLSGIPGQGPIENPASFFNNHRVVINGEYYDPSYGLKHTTLEALETDAIDGFFVLRFLTVNETLVNLDLNGDGDMSDPSVNTRVYVFRQNPPGLDILEQLDDY